MQIIVNKIGLTNICLYYTLNTMYLSSGFTFHTFIAISDCYLDPSKLLFVCNFSNIARLHYAVLHLFTKWFSYLYILEYFLFKYTK